MRTAKPYCLARFYGEKFMPKTVFTMKKCFSVLLEFVSVWNLHQKGGISKLESVQRRATQNSLKNKKYVERCKFLNLTNLRKRRIRGDLIPKQKIENK